MKKLLIGVIALSLLVVIGCAKRVVYVPSEPMSDQELRAKIERLEKLQKFNIWQGLLK